MDDRLQVVLGPYDFLWTQFAERLNGLTDDEYFWEPIAGCWSLRPRGKEASADPVGRGARLLDRQSPPPDPPPFTTIAWRICHMASGALLRYDWTFASHRLTLNDIEWPVTAVDAIVFVTHAHSQWRTAVGALNSAELDQIGLSQMPWGLDQEVRFIDLLAWQNADFLHHAAEVACLRDLYRAGGE